MKVVGLKVLKNKLSTYVRLAEKGERVLITDRDEVIAELIPASARERHVSDAVLADLVRTGVVSPALVGAGEPPPSRPSFPLSDILKGLEDDRSDR